MTDTDPIKRAHTLITDLNKAYQACKQASADDVRFQEQLNSHTDIMINKLSRYMESSGKTYQNHYVTILKWYEEDKDKLRQKGLNKKMNYDVGESL